MCVHLQCIIYRMAGNFRRGLIFMFFVMERFRENYTHESLPCMHMHSPDTHLHCTNDKPANTFCIIFMVTILFYTKIYNREKISAI